MLLIYAPYVQSRADCNRTRLKCDRQQPCQSCVQRGLSISCAYTQQPSHGRDQGLKAPESVHDRIDQLEKLVTILMNEKSSESTSTPHYHPSTESSSSEIPDTPDRVELKNDATSYTNSSHWLNILDGITELRDELDRITIVTSDDCPGADTPGPDILFGRQRYASKSEILAALPPRPESDQLVHSYFVSMDMASAILHKPTFLKEVLHISPFCHIIAYTVYTLSSLKDPACFYRLFRLPQR